MAVVTVDLHTHTTCSDGMLSPEALVRKAAQLDIQTLSITDHDTISGLPAAKAEANLHGIMLVPGVEVSVYFHGRELHMLGYCFDPENDSLLEFLSHFSDQRKLRAKAIIDKLHKMGVKLDYEHVLEHVHGEVVGRPHIAQALVDHGYVKSYEAAFTQYLRNNGPANIQKKLPTAQEAIDVLHRAGGLGVLAHPGHWVSDRDVMRLAQLGMDGVEIIHPSHDAMLKAFYMELTQNLSLLQSGGSDYHGMRPGDESNFGKIGLSETQFDAFMCRCAL